MHTLPLQGAAEQACNSDLLDQGTNYSANSAISTVTTSPLSFAHIPQMRGVQLFLQSRLGLVNIDLL